MKKYNLFKVLAITIFAVWLLTLFIPSSYVDYNGKIVLGSINGVGIFTMLSNLNISISYFSGIAIFIIAVALFYSVLSKTNTYEVFEKKVSSLFKNKTRLLVIISIITFGILSSLVSDYLILLVFVPFVYNIMRENGVDKKVILSSTLVAGMLGTMCNIYNGTLATMFNMSLTTLLLAKAIVLVLSLCILILFVAPKKVVNAKKKSESKTDNKASKKTNDIKTVVTIKNKKVNKVIYEVLTILFGNIGINRFYAKDIKGGVLRLLFCWTLIPTILSVAEFITILTEKSDKDGNIEITSSRRKKVSFGVLLIMFVLFYIGSIIPWETLISKMNIFSDFNVWLSKLNIAGYSVFGNIIGKPVVIEGGQAVGVLKAFGSWNITDSAILLMILTVVMAICSNLKFDKIIENSTSAIKKVLPIAITAMLVSIVLVTTVTTGIDVTIANFILSLTKGFNLITGVIATMVTSIINCDFHYFTSSIGNVFATVVTTSSYHGVIALMLQSIFNLMLLIAPTSVGLVIGLYYLNIPYNKWIGYIWKTFLAILALIIITIIILYALV
ncbi:MAG: SLC13 family permease [Bacilli bacterium]